jgi:hypothetical protein
MGGFPVMELAETKQSYRRAAKNIAKKFLLSNRSLPVTHATAGAFAVEEGFPKRHGPILAAAFVPAIAGIPDLPIQLWARFTGSGSTA